jgi:spore coat polysaccharide biosynthesis protein SpsF
MVSIPINHSVKRGQNTVAIVQGRMASSRLPDKILKDISGKPMLAWVVDQARKARLIDQVVVATTVEPSDDAVESYCRENHISCYRGSMHDVLDRFYQAARLFQADIVVRFTADCPLLDPQLVDHVLEEFFKAGADFAANRLPPPFTRTFPIGLDTEVATFAALERAWKEATAKHDREHVMPYLYEVAGRFKVVRVEAEKDYGWVRWTVDTPTDLELVRKLAIKIQGKPSFTWLDVLDIYLHEPGLAEINADVKHRTMFDVDERYTQ